MGRMPALVSDWMKARAWRKQPASEGQIKYALRLGIDPAGLSKGECAARITHALVMRAIERRQYAMPIMMEAV